MLADPRIESGDQVFDLAFGREGRRCVHGAHHKGPLMSVRKLTRGRRIEKSPRGEGHSGAGIDRRGGVL